ncbi:MAG: hypothetical protein A2Z95_04210 [Gallionellales bacterium GWA2_60_18]|nr:MAG: hypothetical protein A2Z95_04210 [Gallionellales bacterium GWA2_60_18]
MYLEHFGLNEPPFRITPVTEFFFSGANRGEILDALIYSLSEAEGIIKVSGEVGSGKTMLCRMLLERLPGYIETIYLANPSLSREEMLYAIADALGLDIKGERVGVIMQNIQNRLESLAREGKRVVVLVDEAHAMPLDTLEELRLLYNLQVGNFKLLQIVLFGQPELNAKLEQPNMRQLKDRIVHHFHMQPLSRNVLESYLMFRMRAAGYHGPDVFSPAAIKQIANASNGLMRRVNILADKSLLAAFVEDTHNIEPRHVQAAMRDSELEPTRKPMPDKKVLGGAAAAILVAGFAAWWWMHDTPQTPIPSSELLYEAAVVPAMVPTPPPTQVAAQSPPPSPTPAPADTSTIATVTPPVAVAVPPQPAPVSTVAPPVVPAATVSEAAPAPKSRYEQRIAATQRLLVGKQAVASIQLFYNEAINKNNTEGFLRRAEKLGKLQEIYLLPAKSGNKEGLRVLYGAYPSAEAARNAIQYLPSRYQESFAISIYIF